MGQEYLWHPRVHAALGEELRFFFIRTAFTRMAGEVFTKILEEGLTSSSAYLLVGQYEFLIRSWGTLETNNLLQQKLVNRCSEFLGNCLSVSANNIFYPWAGGEPKADDLNSFIASMKGERVLKKRQSFITTHLARLKQENLLLAEMEPRHEKQKQGLKAFTVIRNLKLSAESRQIIEMCLRAEVSAYCGRGHGYDATLYSTTDSFDFVIRWHMPDFPEFIAILRGIINAVESQRAAVVFETYFVAERITPLRDNFLSLVERSGGSSPRDMEHEWQDAIPKLKEVPLEMAEFFRLLCASPGVNLVPETVKENRNLRLVLDAYLSSSSDQFGALVQQYYSNFETRLRNNLVSLYWLPREAAGETEQIRAEWCEALNRKEIPVGREQGRTVPKLSLGDWLLLANKKFPREFDASTARRMQDLITMRNNLSHRGSSMIDLEYLPMFLGQAQSCSLLLKAIDQEAQTEVK